MTERESNWSREPDWSAWSWERRYVASLLRDAGCTDPQPLVGSRAFASGRIAPRCRLCGVYGPSIADVALERTGTPGDRVSASLRRHVQAVLGHRAVRSDGTFYEDDEPIEDVERAYERGVPCVTQPPRRYRTLTALGRCPEGTLVRASGGELDVLAWRVATTDSWAVTGFQSLWDAQHMLNVSEHWEYAGHVGARV